MDRDPTLPFSLIRTTYGANPDPDAAGPDLRLFSLASLKVATASPAVLTSCSLDPSIYIRTNQCPRCFSTSATNCSTSANRPLITYTYRVDWVLLPRFTPFTVCPSFETLRESATLLL